ncbi:MAG: hypothetical protein WC637_12660 [Victivallales bacterium]
MKKIFALAVSAMALGLLVGCEDKQAELQQNQRMDAISSEVVKLRNDLEEVKVTNQQLTGKINLVTAWLSKKVEEERARAAKAAAPASDAKTSAGLKNGPAATTVKPGTAPAGTKTGSTPPPAPVKKKTNP